MSSVHALALPSLDSTFGCLFLAGILSTALWGVGCLQLFYYYEASIEDSFHSARVTYVNATNAIQKFAKTDKRWLTVYIFLIWSLDTVHQAILVKSLYMYFVKEFGNLLYLAHPQRILYYVALLTAVTDAMVQSLFVMRAWHLSDKNRTLTAALSISVLAQLAINVAYFAQVYNFANFTQLVTVLNTERALNVVVLFTDTFIAAVLICLLRRMRSGLEKTDTVIRRLVIYTVSTGLLTSAWAVVALVGAEVRPTSFIYVLVDVVFPKLYFNCMLASLNERANHRKHLGDEVAMSMRFNSHVSGSEGVRTELDVEALKKFDRSASASDTDGVATPSSAV